MLVTAFLQIISIFKICISVLLQKQFAHTNPLGTFHYESGWERRMSWWEENLRKLGSEECKSENKILIAPPGRHRVKEGSRKSKEKGRKLLILCGAILILDCSRTSTKPGLHNLKVPSR